VTAGSVVHAETAAETPAAEESAPVQIHVQTLTGQRHTLSISLSSRVEAVKQQVMECDGLALAQQQLLFGGRRLQPYRRLAEAGVQADSTLFLVVSRAAAAAPPAAPSAPDEPLSLKLVRSSRLAERVMLDDVLTLPRGASVEQLQSLVAPLFGWPAARAKLRVAHASMMVPTLRDIDIPFDSEGCYRGGARALGARDRDGSHHPGRRRLG